MDPKEKLFKLWSGEKETRNLERMSNSFYKEMEEHVEDEVHEILEEVEKLMLKGQVLNPGMSRTCWRRKLVMTLRKSTKSTA